MTEVRAILGVVKRALKARGMTYGEVARRLGLSEPSVKRLFSTGRISLDRLAKLAGLLDLTLAELVQEAAGAAPVVARLTQAQEAGLVADPKLLLVAVLALNHWGLADSFFPPEVVAKVEQAVTATGHEVEFHTYAGAEHAFDNPNPLFHQAEAAELARDRTMACLGRHVPNG